jgi:hypothetical protein
MGMPKKKKPAPQDPYGGYGGGSVPGSMRGFMGTRPTREQFTHGVPGWQSQWKREYKPQWHEYGEGRRGYKEAGDIERDWRSKQIEGLGLGMETRGQQQALADAMRRRAEGKDLISQMIAQQQAEQIGRQAQSAARSMPGGYNPMAARQAMQQQYGAGTQLAGQAAVAGAQEQLMAERALGGQLAGMRSQDLARQQALAGIRQQDLARMAQEAGMSEQDMKRYIADQMTAMQRYGTDVGLGQRQYEFERGQHRADFLMGEAMKGEALKREQMIRAEERAQGRYQRGMSPEDEGAPWYSKFGSGLLTAAGTGLGAYFGGPMGASIGGSLGSGLGAAWESVWD